MTTPLVLSTSPLPDAVDVTIDTKVVFTFNVALDASMVSKATFYLADPDTWDVIPITITYDPTNKRVTLIPRNALLQTHVYQATAVGLSSGGLDYVRSSDGDALADNYSFTFRTKQERYVSLDEVATRADIESVAPIRAVEATLPASIANAATATELSEIKISASTPRAFASEVSTSLSQIVLVLDHTIAAYDSDTFQIYTYPALGDDAYLGARDGQSRPWMNDSFAPTGLFTVGAESVSPPVFANPSGTWSVNGSKATWTKGAGEPDFMLSQEVQVVVGPSISGALTTNAAMSGTVSDELALLFTTQYFPKFVDHRMVRVELGSLVASLYDDTINRILHKNSVDAWEQAAGHFDIDDPYPAVKRYVKFASIADIMEVLALKDGVSIVDESKMLGDFQYSRRPNSSGPTVMQARYHVALKEKERWLRELRKYRGVAGIQVTVRGMSAANERSDYRTRTWDTTTALVWDGLVPNVAGANTADERLIKFSRATDHHGQTAAYGDPSRSARTVFKSRDKTKPI